VATACLGQPLRVQRRGDLTAWRYPTWPTTGSLAWATRRCKITR